jgi:tetratricopeptide (TPR) repeat protein
MNTVLELHNQAMKLSQRAMVAHHNGDKARAETLAREAFEYDSQAAELIPNEKASEPTRSILYCSAASLAYDCQEWEAAKRLITKALSGYPSERIKDELKTLSKRVNFEYYLQTQGVTLGDDELHLFLLGSAVASGTIVYDEFVNRLTPLTTLIDKTALRLLDIDYHKAGQMPSSFIPALSTPHREENFAITIKLVAAEHNQSMLKASLVIDEIMTGIELINGFNDEALKELIKAPGYYQNFLALTHNIAPDGDQINFVGLSSLRKNVSLTRLGSEIELGSNPVSSCFDLERKPIKVKGILNDANSLKPQVIGLTTQENGKYKIFVGEGLDDYVRFYFGRWVVVSGEFDGKFIYLNHLQTNPSHRLMV